jgi:hypothetical protein
MNRTRTLSLVLTLTLFSAPTLAHGQESARDIIDRVDRIMRGESSYGVATMDVVTENWERSMTMEVWSLGTDYSLIRITAPNKEAGTATLKAGDDIWNYLPRVDRSIKIPASLMMGAWMGSHFTNDDLVRHRDRVRGRARRRGGLGVRADAEAGGCGRLGAHHL